jgi:CO dehydrogenase/acetyl-CoA synthase gamma subunit (corrinoid Fe-S protein)
MHIAAIIINTFFIVLWFLRDCFVIIKRYNSFVIILEFDSSSVKAALKILEDKELVYRTNEGYVIYDRFMDLWLKRI